MENLPTLDERRDHLRQYKFRVLVDDADDLTYQTWGNAIELLERLVGETDFELHFVNHGESGLIEDREQVVRVMTGVQRSAGRNILAVLDNMIETEVDFLSSLTTRTKSIIVVLLSDVPTDPPPLTLKKTIHFAFRCLTDAELSTELLTIRFIQTSFSRKLNKLLQELSDDLPLRRPDYVNLVDFVQHKKRPMDDHTLWKILLGSNILPATLPVRPRVASSSLLPITPPILSPILQAPPTTSSSLLFDFPACLVDRGFRTTRTYDLSAGFTLMGWIFETDRSNARAHDFVTFHSSRSPIFRASTGEAQGDTISLWFPNLSGNLKAPGFPIDLWTFICVSYDGDEVRFGLHGVLSNRSSLSPPSGLDKVTLVISPSKTASPTSVANIRLYGRILTQEEILSEYSNSRPDSAIA